MFTRIYIDNYEKAIAQNGYKNVPNASKLRGVTRSNRTGTKIYKKFWKELIV
jgi:hypothetical protein